MANWDRLRGKFNWVKSTRGKVLNLNYCNSRGSRFRPYFESIFYLTGEMKTIYLRRMIKAWIPMRKISRFSKDDWKVKARRTRENNHRLGWLNILIISERYREISKVWKMRYTLRNGWDSTRWRNREKDYSFISRSTWRWSDWCIIV